MPRQQLQGARYSTPIRATLPSKQYPFLRSLVKELDFMCPTCTGAEGHQVWYPWSEIRQEPGYGPGKYTTVFGVFCPICGSILEGPFVSNGRIDLLRCAPDYKRPVRQMATTAESGVQMEDEDLEEVEVEREAPREIKTKKKTSDLSPVTRKKKPKGAVKAALKKAAKSAEQE